MFAIGSKMLAEEIGLARGYQLWQLTIVCCSIHANKDNNSACSNPVANRIATTIYYTVQTFVSRTSEVKVNWRRRQPLGRQYANEPADRW